MTDQLEKSAIGGGSAAPFCYASDRPVLPWSKFPDYKPSDFGKCIVLLWKQGSLGLSKYIWVVNWNAELKLFEDFAGCDDMRKGALVKYFINEPQFPPEA